MLGADLRDVAIDRLAKPIVGVEELHSDSGDLARRAGLLLHHPDSASTKLGNVQAVLILLQKEPRLPECSIFPGVALLQSEISNPWRSHRDQSPLVSIAEQWSHQS